MLKPLLDTFPWVVNNSIETVNMFSSIEPYQIPSNADVDSLYTNIDINKGIQAITIMLQSRLDLFSLDLIILIKDVLQWVLTNNYFTYKDTWYHQIRGTAMGTNCAPSYENLFLVIMNENG